MKQDRRQQIIAAAMELFAKKGFRGTTTRDLATQADVNEAIIFRYFKTKEELYSAIIEHKVGERDLHREGIFEQRQLEPHWLMACPGARRPQLAANLVENTTNT